MDDGLLALLPGVVLVLDAEGRVERCNPGLAQELGRESPAVPGLPAIELFQDADRETARQAIEAARRGVSAQFTAALLAAPGKPGGRGYLFIAARAGAVGVSLVGQPMPATEDIARQRLDAIVNAADVAIYTHSLEGMITSWNAAAERMFGYRAEEIIGRPVLTLIPPGRAAEERQTWQRAARGEVVRLYETERLCRDGALLAASVTVTPMRDAHGNITGATRIVHDISSRQRIEAALRESEQRFRTTLDSIIESCQLLGFDWRYLYLNEAAAVQNRRPNKELLGRTMMECWPGIEGTEVYAMLRRTMEERIALQSELEFRFPDGSAGHFEVHGQPVPEGLFILSIDISERRRQEREVHRMTRLYDALSHVNQVIARMPARDELFRQVCQIVVQHGGVGMAWIGLPDAGGLRVLPVASCGDPDGSVEQAEVRLDDSPEGRGPTGTAMREARPYICNDVFADDATRPWRATFERYGCRSSAAFPILVDGRPQAVLSVYAGEKDFFQSQEVALLQEAAADIGFALEIQAREANRIETERRAARERQFSEAMIESLPGVAYFYDESGHFLRWNQNFLTVTGYSAEAMATRHPRDFFLGEDRARVEAAIARTFATGEAAAQAGFVARDGTVTPYYFTGRRLEMDGRAYLVGVGIDVSAREAAEAEVRRLNEELEKRIAERTVQLEVANRELESFSYSVSHDLRAPLRAVNGFCDILVEDFAAQLPEEVQRYLRRIHEAGQRMGELIDDLLDLSRLSRQPLRRAAVDMTALARSVAEEQQAQAADRRIDVRIAELPPCEGDNSLLRQVWVNLISNAIKYTRGRSLALVEIGSQSRDGMHIYYVRDNGTGFDMRYAGKLFGVFQRLHRNEEFEGTGVGLAIVNRVLQRHGGRIWAEAALDRGATFFFTVDGEART
jgi:hypothetical protein